MGDVFTANVDADALSLYVKIPFQAHTVEDYNAIYLNKGASAFFEANEEVYKYNAPIDIDINNFIDTIAKEG